MILFFTIIVALFILLIGFSVLNLFNFQIKSFIEKLSYSWGLGVGLVAAQLFTYSLISIEWSRLSLAAPWVIVIIFSLWLHRPKINFKKGKFDRVEKIFLTLIFLLLGFTAIESQMRPVQAWDAWSNWLLRPKVFFINNNISIDYVKYANDEYPQIIPLMSTFDYELIGRIDDKEVLFLFFIFYLSITGLFYAKSNELIGKKWALIFTFLLMSTQNLIRHGGRFEAGQADLPLAFFILSSACILMNFLKSNKLSDLILLNIFLGFTALVKNDGIPILLIGNIITLIYVIKSKKLIYISAFLPSAIMFGVWNIYKSLNDYPKNFIAGSGAFHIDEIGSIIFEMTKEFFNIQNWNLLWIVFLFSLVIYYKNIRKIWPIFLLISTQWFFYVLAFILSPYPLAADHVIGIIDRLYIHIAPLAVLILVSLISINYYSNDKTNNLKSKSK